MAGPPAPPFGAANRTDLNVPTPSPQPQGQPNGKPQAMQLPTGTGYGERTQLQQAQQAVPLPSAPQAPGIASRVGPSGPAPASLTMGQAMQHAKQFAPPNLGGLTRPTERPNEPVTAGLPGGPSTTPTAGGQQGGSLASMLSRAAQATSSAALSSLAARAATLGQ